MIGICAILLIGHGRMGQLVESLAPAHGCEVAGIVTSRSGPGAIARGDLRPVDVAIDFSLADAVRDEPAAAGGARASTS